MIDVQNQECDGMPVAKMLAAIDECDNLTDWEIDRVEEWLNVKRPLTHRELVKINQIYDERVD